MLSRCSRRIAVVHHAHRNLEHLAAGGAHFEHPIRAARAVTGCLFHAHGADIQAPPAGAADARQPCPRCRNARRTCASNDRAVKAGRQRAGERRDDPRIQRQLPPTATVGSSKPSITAYRQKAAAITPPVAVTATAAAGRGNPAPGCWCAAKRLFMRCARHLDHLRRIQRIPQPADFSRLASSGRLGQHAIDVLQQFLVSGRRLSPCPHYRAIRTLRRGATLRP